MSILTNYLWKIDLEENSRKSEGIFMQKKDLQIKYGTNREDGSPLAFNLNQAAGSK